MLTLAAIIITFTLAHTLTPTPVSGALLIAMGASIAIVAGRNASAPETSIRVCYLAGVISYYIALPWIHDSFVPHWQATPDPIAWLLPVIYLAFLPLLLPLAPLLSRASYAFDAYRWLRNRPR